LRDLEFFWHLTSEKLQGIETPDDYLVESLLVALSYAASNPDRLIAFMPEIRPALTEFLVIDSAYELHFVNFLRPKLVERAGEVSQSIDDGIFVICEWFSRMLASYLARPSRLCQQPDQMRPRLHLMLPALAVQTTN
jgi:hypothetical protein